MTSVKHERPRQAGPQPGRVVRMARKTSTAQCPGTVCTCGGTEQVSMRKGIDRKTGRPTHTFAPCAPLKAQGWRGNVATVEWADGFCDTCGDDRAHCPDYLR